MMFTIFFRYLGGQHSATLRGRCRIIAAQLHLFDPNVRP
jgi:hypothetical protein